jgi:hypothetical protein
VTFAEPQRTSWSPEPHFPCPSPAAPAGRRLQLHPADDDERPVVEQFIADVYRRHFGARLLRFMPVLVSRSSDGRVSAAAGYRSASEPLFLERYLPEPIERMLARASGQRIERQQIVEVGQFASRRPGDGRPLMPELACHLVALGFRWAVITATTDLRRLFRLQNLSALAIGTAEARHLGDEARWWGHYYRHAPKVVAGDLLVNLARLQRGRR